jgi:hypothetical protein
MKTTCGTRRDLAEASQVRIFQSGLKTSGDAMTVVHVAPSWRSREDQVEDGRVDALGYVRPCYPYFVVFIVLGHMDIFVI